MDRNNQGLLVIAAALVAFSVFRVMQDTQPPAQLLSIPAVVVGDVLDLRFEGPDGVLAASRSEAGWAITEPESLPADTRKVEALLGDWAGGFSADLEVSTNSDPDEDMSYGLDPEHRTVLQFRAAAGPVVELHLGKSIAGGSHYLRAPGSTEVYRGRVPGSSRLKPAIEFWEDRRLLPGLSSDLVRLEVRGSQGVTAFNRSSVSEPWQSATDPELPTSDSKINALGRSLGNVTARSILRGSDAEAERSSAALEAPRLTIVMVDGAGATTTVHLGGDHADKGFLYGVLLGDPRLFVLPKSVLRNFDKDAASLGGESSARSTAP